MPDICDLILDDHHTFRRRFAELDELRAAGAAPERLAPLWEPLSELLEVHAAAEEELFYPRLLKKGDNADEETEDAISDHNEIRDAVRRARGAEVGTDDWWKAVLDARHANSDHMAEEEREGVADFRVNAEPEVRDDLGGRWLSYKDRHAGGRDVDVTDKDPDAYIASHE
ncbi:MAG TPA: hemerythrin domain-containing protein [Acidimicrobiales bacterium]|nr:hemerythrin domain-containing protein [Acidimicrobiales bacterium]